MKKIIIDALNKWIESTTKRMDGIESQMELMIKLNFSYVELLKDIVNDIRELKNNKENKE